MERVNEVISASNGKPISIDYRIPKNTVHAPLVIFLHGFKGFKDWGHFNAIADWFVENGIGWVKFNFSMNGTTPEQPTDFADLEAFGNNTFSQEVADTKAVISWVEENLKGKYHPGQINLVGHSRGGGIALLVAATDLRVHKLITWASVCNFEKRFSAQQFEEWKQNGVIYILNGRTKQNMPLYKVIWDDYLENIDQLSIEKAAKQLRNPYLIIHGEMDPTVPYLEAKQLQQWTGATLDLLPSADHVFGGRHPYTEEKLPKETLQLLEITRRFIKS